MGWTIHYHAKIPSKQIDLFLQEENSAHLTLDEKCEEYKWESTKDGLVSGFTKVHFSKESEKDFLTILKALKELSEKWAKSKIIVSDDYYLQKEDIRKVDISKVLVPPEKSEDKPFSIDDYVFQYEIPHGITVKMEHLLNSIEDKEWEDRAVRSISAWKSCGPKEIYARKFMFKPHVKDIDKEMIFLEAPSDTASRQSFLDALNRTGNPGGILS